MNDYKNFCEYTVHPVLSGKLILIRVLLLTFYTLFTLVYLWIFGLNLRALALLIMLPFIMYAIIKLTWRRTDIQYEFLIEAGELSVAKIYGNAVRRQKVRVNIPDMTLIAPYTRERAGILNASNIAGVKNFSACPDSDDAWICVYPDRERGKKRVLIIETDDEMRRVLRLCNPSAVVRDHL